VVLRDLGSSNGTFVNAAPARERVLEHGDRIRAGDSLFLYLRAEEGPAPRPASDEVGDRTVRVDPGAAGIAPGNGDARLDVALEPAAASRPPLVHAMVGDSPPMQVVFDRIRKAAPADSTVLILGETGTGKELAARAIHDNSRRARGPFLAVNCAALTEALLESELFGHERGAFTGAVALKRGKFEIAHGGTLFLDEVGELAPALQAKLLRVLQAREFERVGGTRTMRVDVRVIAATNQDLAQAAAAGRFRQDLWFRLNVISLTMPTLRARRQDIPALAAHFVRKFGQGRQLELSPDAMRALEAYDWPGNVRELEHAVESAVVLACADVIVADQRVLDTKRRVILDAIDRSSGNYTAAAKLLGINPTYLHRLIRNLRLKDTVPRR
jgi:transcriptional regulator with GAF, ATPase, and Fis domain